MGAIYAPNHDAQKIDSALIAGVEKNKSFDDVELKRVKNLIQNANESLLTSAAAVGGMLE